MEQVEAREDATAARLRELMLPLEPEHLVIDNFSHQHARGSGSHYRLALVSRAFGGLSRVARHRLVYQAAADLMPDPVHALMLELYTPEEWRAGSRAPGEPPPCRGGE